MRTESAAQKKSLPSEILNALPVKVTCVVFGHSWAADGRTDTQSLGQAFPHPSSLRGALWRPPPGRAVSQAFPFPTALPCCLVRRGFRTRIQVFPSFFREYGRYLLLGFSQWSFSHMSDIPLDHSAVPIVLLVLLLNSGFMKSLRPVYSKVSCGARILTF